MIDGRVIACDVNEDFTNIAKKFWTDAGVAEKIRLCIAPASQTLKKLIDAGEEGTFDFAFVDADKTGYEEYFELSLTLLRKAKNIVIYN